MENQILDQYFGDIIAVIAEGRKKKPEDVKALIDDGPFVGTSALVGGLVDELLLRGRDVREVKGCGEARFD